MGPLFVGMKRKDEEVWGKEHLPEEPGEESPALESYRRHLEQMPERQRAKGIRRILGIALESISQPGSGARSLGERLQYPGYQDRMQAWLEKEQKLGKLAKAESEQLEDKRRAEESRARIKASERAEQYWQTQQAKQNMPTRPKYSSPAALKAAKLQEALESEDPEVRKSAQEELDRITSGGHSTGLTTRDYYDRSTGERVTVFFNHQGQKISEFRHRDIDPRPSPPVRRRTRTITSTDNEGNVTYTTVDENGREVASFTKKKTGKSKTDPSSKSESAHERLRRLFGGGLGIDPAELKK